MLEKPNLPDKKLISCLQAEYGLQITHITFLPLGADVNTVVYRATCDTTAYFVKLRRVGFEETSVIPPRFLSDQGITQIIAPIQSCSQQLWARVEGFTVILYPFVAGSDGFEADLTDHQWVELGVVRTFQERVTRTTFQEAVAAQLAEFLQAKRVEIAHLAQHAVQLAANLQGRSLEFVLCHADIHAGIVLLGNDGKWLQLLINQFLPNNVVEIAYRSDVV